MIRIGIAGWDYPDWDGVVYPVGRPRGFDRLAYVARFVDVVEINSSFYRPIAPRTASSWVRRTEARGEFHFTAKAHRTMTHEREVDLDEAVEPTLAGLRPLLEAGRLGALLVQFPQSFHCTPPSRDRLERLAESLEGWPAVVEVRHASWEAELAADWFRRHGLGWCAVDQPRVGRATAGLVERVTSPVGYLRLHGRNADNWFRAGAGRDARYDYRYSHAELEALAEPVRRMAEQARELYVVQNNHFRGQALANALQFKHILESRRPAAPAGLVDAYPDLVSEVTARRDTLF